MKCVAGNLLAAIYFGMVVKQVGASCTKEDQIKCNMKLHGYIDPVKQFFEKLSKVPNHAANSLTQGETQQERCIPFTEAADFELSVGSCYQGSLYNIFNVKLEYSAVKDFKIQVERNSVHDRNITEEVCSDMCQLCPTTRAPPMCTPCSKPPICTPFSTHATDENVSKPTKCPGATNQGDDTTTSSTTSNAAKQHEPQQESHTDIIIASISSFLAGVLITLFTVCAYIKCISKRKAKDTSNNKQNTAPLHLQVLSYGEGSIPFDQKTYESLNHTTHVASDQSPADHVYLGLGTKPDLHGFSNTKMDGQNAKYINSNDKKSQVYEDTGAAEYHVYNALKAGDIPMERKAKEPTETKHVGIKPSEYTNTSVKQLDITSGEEDRNYFLLENEGPKTTKEEALESDQGKDINNDQHPSIDHAYFTLEKDESSVCTLRKFANDHDLTIETNRGSDGHTYNTLEKI